MLGLSSFATELFVAIVLGPLVWVVLPTVLLICVLDGRGELRTFAIGALVPIAFMWVNGPDWKSASLVPLLFLGAWMVVEGAVCGAVAIVVRRELERRAKSNVN